MKHLKLVAIVALFAALTLVVANGLVAASDDATRPNIILIMTDDQDVDSLGRDGNSMSAMRKLLSFPYGRWINFTNAFAGDSICCPARATVLSGQFSHTHGVTTNGLGHKLDDEHTLAVWLDNAGYNTALVGKYLNNYRRFTGRDYTPPGWDLFQDFRNGEDVDAYSDFAVDYLRNTSPPYFLFLAYKAPHKPAKPPKRYQDADVYVPPPRPNVNEADVSDKPKWVQRLRLVTPTALKRNQEERLESQRELLAIDDGVEAILNTLEETGQLDNTLVIFTTDHGVSWASHRKIGKWCPYEECSQIPLLIRYPGASGNRVEDRLVSNVDLAATIAEYAGVTPTVPQDGRSFMALLENRSSNWEEAVLLERHVGSKYYGMRVPGWKYIEYLSGETELYHIATDPYELENLAEQPQHLDTQDEIAAILHERLGLYAVVGRVTDANGNPIEGVTVSRNSRYKDKTDANGRYALYQLEPGTYTLNLSKRGYTFTPSSARVTIANGDVVQDFTGHRR